MTYSSRELAKAWLKWNGMNCTEKQIERIIKLQMPLARMLAERNFLPKPSLK